MLRICHRTVDILAGSIEAFFFRCFKYTKIAYCGCACNEVCALRELRQCQFFRFSWIREASNIVNDEFRIRVRGFQAFLETNCVFFDKWDIYSCYHTYDILLRS
ncbi:hypothetical protein D3C86_1852180 [compost metagenome]